MILVAKNGKEYIPLLIGSIESRDLGEFISCIEAGNSPAKDMFGKIAIIKIHVSEIKGFKGSYSFATPFNLHT